MRAGPEGRSLVTASGKPRTTSDDGGIPPPLEPRISSSRYDTAHAVPFSHQRGSSGEGKGIPPPLEPRSSVTRYDTTAGYSDVAGGNQPLAYDRGTTLGRGFAAGDSEDIPFFWFHSFGAFFHWLFRWTIPGLGMFSEAYYIFSIGNVRPLFQAEYPACWAKYQTCSKQLVQSVDYMQIIGIIFGMCLLGVVGDRIGRKWGSVTTASIMLVGAALLTAVDGKTEKGLTIMYLIAQFVFGFGVGGEYPMAAGSAAERAEAGGREFAKKRGREVVLTFSMQGVGNFVNTAALCILIPIYGITIPNKRNHAFPYRTQGLSGVWRTAFGIGGIPILFMLLSGVWRTAFGVGGIPILFMLYWRIFRLRESPVWAANRTAGGLHSNAKADRRRNVSKLFSMFYHRLVATAGSWFLWDFSFYGNKVFQSSFIKILSPGASILTSLLWTLLNSGIALLGYWVSALFIDAPGWGRLRTQIYGFAMVGIIFFVCAIWYHPLVKPGGIHVFQILYFFSSFWGQFGPNTTTFLLAGELYPTAVRTTAHGLSAGIAKMGALWASVWFNYLDNRTKFWTSASLNIGGLLLTVLFMPDPLRVSLAEVDRRFKYALQGRVYHGEAVNRKNLSWFEILMGHGRHYDPAADEEDLYKDGLASAQATKGAKGSQDSSPGGSSVELGAKSPNGNGAPHVEDYGGGRRGPNIV